MTGKKSYKDTAAYLGRSPYSRYMEGVHIINPAKTLKFIPKEIIGHVDQERFNAKLSRVWNSYEGGDTINQMLFLDIQTSLVDEMLVKSDRMTMHQGIEGRVPFLDHRLVEFAMSIPSDLKIQNGFGKLPLRKLLERKLSSALAFRKKTGFNSPLKKMLQEDKVTAADFIKKINVLGESGTINKLALEDLKASISSGGFDPSTAFSLYALSQFVDKS